MLLHRVFPHVPKARKSDPGHPLYLHPGQGKGRWDNPDRYLAWYLASEPSSAVGETFAALTTWREEMFAFPQVRGARRALGTYELPDDLPYVDLDDARTLLERGMRPSQVVEHNRAYTQSRALEVYEEGRWSGIRWWSAHRPQWRVWCLWDLTPGPVTIEPLDLGHPAVHDAAGALGRAVA